MRGVERIILVLSMMQWKKQALNLAQFVEGRAKG